MKLEDPTETWDFFMKGAGESYVSHVESYQVDTNSALGTYQDAKGARMEKRARIDLLDLKEQGPGEAHFFFKSKIVRGRFFFANPKPVKHIRLNHFLKVEALDDKEVERFLVSAKQMESLLEEGADFIDAQDAQSMMHDIYHTLTHAQTNALNASYIALDVAPMVPVDALTDEFFADPTETFREELNIFMPMRRSEHVKDIAHTGEDISAFGMALLNQADTREYLEYCQRLLGKDAQYSSHVANELVTDLRMGTDYPPAIRPMLTAEALTEQVQQFAAAVTTKKAEAAADKDKK
jgi:intracellular multiplication protein IcmO